LRGGEISLPYLAQAPKPKFPETKQRTKLSKTHLKARQRDFDLWYIHCPAIGSLKRVSGQLRRFKWQLSIRPKAKFKAHFSH
jgi:hypothetical protein